MKKIILFIFLMLSAIITFVYAKEPLLIGNALKFNTKQPVEISSDFLEIDTANKNLYIFFYKKNVVLIQDKSKIYSDTIKIYYDNLKKKIKKAEIKGNVKIKSKDIICNSDKVIYNLDKQSVIISGNVKILQGSNVFYGSELDIDLLTNKSYFKGGKNRIKTFFSGQK
jgi:lipopolysaccharide transport protein LptA